MTDENQEKELESLRQDLERTKDSLVGKQRELELVMLENIGLIWENNRLQKENAELRRIAYP